MSVVEQPVESGVTEFMVMSEKQFIIVLHWELPKVLLFN